MSATYGVGLDTLVERLNLDIKFRLTSKYGNKGLRVLYKVIGDHDMDKSGDLDHEEFIKALNYIGIFCKKHEQTALFQYYDKNNDGRINYDEFLNSFRIKMNQRRLDYIKKVFKGIDLNNDGLVSLDEATIFYKAESVDLKYIQGNHSKTDAVKEFVSLIQADEQGNFGLAEFINYYTDISSTIGKDEIFGETLYNTWGICENWKAATDQEVSDYVKVLRTKVINKTSGVMDEYLLASRFKEYDVDNSGLLHRVQLQAICMKLNIEIPDNIVTSMFSKLSSCRGDFVLFKQFQDFILYNTYK